MKVSQKKLERWERANLITPEQKVSILKFESETDIFSITKLLTCIATFSIGVGIIFLVAMNWNAISDSLKLIVVFLLLSIVTVATYFAYLKQKKRWFENGLIVIFLLAGASIGLITQVFQLSRTPADWYLFWALCGVPLCLLTKSKVIPIVWVPLFCFSFFASSLALSLFNFLYPLVIDIIEILKKIPIIKDIDVDAIIRSLGDFNSLIIAILLSLIVLLIMRAFKRFGNFLEKKTVFSSKTISVILGYCSILILGIMSVGYVQSLTGGLYGSYNLSSEWRSLAGATSKISILLLAWCYLGCDAFFAYKKFQAGRINRDIILGGVSLFVFYCIALSAFSASSFFSGFGLILSGVVLFGISYVVKKIIQKIKKQDGLYDE